MVILSSMTVLSFVAALSLKNSQDVRNALRSRVPCLINWMRKHFNVEYGSRSSCHRRFRMADLSFHRPVGVDQHRAPEAEI